MGLAQVRGVKRLWVCDAGVIYIPQLWMRYECVQVWDVWRCECAEVRCGMQM